MTYFINNILDLIFPKTCIGCDIKHTSLCLTCISKFPPSKNIGEENISALFDYKNDTVKKALWSLKYRHNKSLAKSMARIIYDNLLEEINDLNTFWQMKRELPLVIPIPLSKNKLKERGYNQAELLAKELSIMDKNKSFLVKTNIFFKTKDTPAQVSIKNRVLRLKNLKGCFEVRDKNFIKNRNIILLDDITTTGATFREASSVLEDAGANKVICIALAH